MLCYFDLTVATIRRQCLITGKHLFACTAAFCVILFPAMATAEIRFDTGSGSSVRLYGQFSPALQVVDDGVNRYDTMVDNSHSNSRVGLWFEQPLDSSVFKFNFETAVGFRQSSTVNQNFTPKAFNYDARRNIRKIDLSLGNSAFGTFFVGQGNMATNGIAWSDLSGTTLVNYNSLADTAGLFGFRTAAGALSGIPIAAAFPNFDGPRSGRIRYDTPSFNGFQFRIAAGKELLIQQSNFKTYDAALVYQQEFDGINVQGGFGFARDELGNGVKRNNVLGSFSVLFPSGFNITFAAGDRSSRGTYTYGKVGYIGNWFSVGKTHLAIDYYFGNDTTSAGSEAKSYSFGVVQRFESVRIDAYLGIRNYSLSEVGAAYQDLSSLLVGAQWKF